MIKSGKFSCQAGRDTVHVGPLRLMLVLTGLYLPLALAFWLFSRIYVRRQSWRIEENCWICEETAFVFGSLKHQRSFHIPASAIVYRMTSDGGDPAFVLSGTVWMFFLVLLGAARIHTGLSAASNEMLVSGIFCIVLGLVLDIACMLIHQAWMRRKTWQIGLIDKSTWTMMDPAEAVPA